MNDKYYEVIFALVDIIKELKNEIRWKNVQLETKLKAKDKEIERLKEDEA